MFLFFGVGLIPHQRDQLAPSNIKRGNVTGLDDQSNFMVYIDVTLLRIITKGRNSLETNASESAATMTKNWDAEKDDKLLSCIEQRKEGEWREAFAAFYRRHKSYLYGICYNLVNRYKFGFFNEDDVFQTTMLKVCESAGTFMSDGITDAQELEDKARAWLGRITENVVFDLIRRKPNCVPINYEMIDGNESNAIDGTVNAFEVAEPVECEETEKVKRTRDAIETLSRNEQEAIWVTCQFFQCRDHQHTPTKELDEIVQSMGVSKVNFRKIRQRAREKIQKHMTNQKNHHKQNEPSKFIRLE